MRDAWSPRVVTRGSPRVETVPRRRQTNVPETSGSFPFACFPPLRRFVRSYSWFGLRGSCGRVGDVRSVGQDCLEELLGPRVLGLGEDLRRRSLFGDAALVEEDDAVG